MTTDIRIVESEQIPPPETILGSIATTVWLTAIPPLQLSMENVKKKLKEKEVRRAIYHVLQRGRNEGTYQWMRIDDMSGGIEVFDPEHPEIYIWAKPIEDVEVRNTGGKQFWINFTLSVVGIGLGFASLVRNK